MTVGKKYFDPATLMQVAMVISVLRPELQGFIGQNTTPPMPMFYQHNSTGVALAPSITSNTDFYLAAKEAAADSSNPLNEFLDWHTSSQNHFDSDSVAMLFDGEVTYPPREARHSFSTELDSGYSSDGGRSPSTLSSVSSSPPHNHLSGTGNFPEAESDLSVYGASGYTPPPSDLLDLKSLDFELEDFIDVDSILYDPPDNQDKVLSSPEPSSIKNESGLAHNAAFERKVPSSPQDFKVPSETTNKNPLDDLLSLNDPFTFQGLDGQFYDPFSIDFPAVNEEFQDHGSSEDAAFDFDSLADNLEYNFPLDVFNPSRQSLVDTKGSSLIEPEHNFLPQLPPATNARNHSGFPSSGSLQTPLCDENLHHALLPFVTDVAVKQENPEVPEISCFSPSTKPCSSTSKKNAREFSGLRSGLDTGFTASEEEIVEMSISEFNSFLESLSDADAQTVRDIRRRGKNKVAARLCRKRKIDVVSDIDVDIQGLKDQKKAMLEERKKLQAENAYFKSKISELQERVFKSLRDEHGEPLSPREYSLFQGSNGSTYVGKNIDSEAQRERTL